MSTQFRDVIKRTFQRADFSKKKCMQMNELAGFYCPCNSNDNDTEKSPLTSPLRPVKKRYENECLKIKTKKF